MFSIHANLKNITLNFQSFFKSIAEPLGSYDLSPGEVLQTEALDNLVALQKSLYNLKSSFNDSAATIAKTAEKEFGSSKLFSDFISDLQTVERKNRQAASEFFELSRLGTLTDPNNISAFNSVSASVTAAIASQYEVLKQIAEVVSKDEEVPSHLLDKFSRSQEILNESVQKLDELQKKARTNFENSKRIQQSVDSINTSILGSVRDAYSEFQSVFRSVKSGNFKLAKKHLEQMHAKIKTAREIEKVAAKTGTVKPNLFTRVIFTTVKIFDSIIKGFEFLLQPIQIFANLGVFTLVTQILRVIGLANKFNLDLINNRGSHQLQYDLNVSLDPKIVAQQLRKSDEEIAKLMRDTEFHLDNNVNNIYQLNKEQLLQLDSMTSNINLRRLVEESGQAITTNEARMKIVNEVITYQKTLGVEASSITESLDEMTDGHQFTFEQSAKALAYLSKVAFVGGLSAHRLFMSFRGMQSRMSGLNTRISGIINLISLVQQTRLMNKKGEEEFVSQLKSFTTGNENLFRDVSMGLVTEEDLRVIFQASKEGALVGNKAADSILQRDIDTSLARLKSDTGTNFESAILGLQAIVSTDPSLQFGYGFAKLRRSLLPIIDILKATPEQLGNFMAVNLRSIEQAVGPQYAKFAMDMLRILLNIKKRSPKPVTTFKEVIEFQRLRDAQGVKIDAEQAAEVESQDAKLRLFKQRQHFTDLFAGIQAYLDFLFIDINNILHSLTNRMTALFSGGFSLAGDVMKYTNLSNDIPRIVRQLRESGPNEELRSDLVSKIIQLDDLRAKIFATIGDNETYAPLREELTRREPKIRNEDLPVEALAGLNEPQLVRYYSNYGAEIARRTDPYQGQAESNLSSNQLKDQALDAFLALPASLRSKIGSQQFTMLFTMMAAARPGATPPQVAAILQKFLDEVWGEAEKVQKTGFVKHLDIFGWFKDNINQMSGSTTVQKMQIKPSLLRPLADIAGASSDPEVRKALLRGFFRAAAKQPKAVDLIDQTQKRLTREDEASVVAFQDLFRKEARNAIYESNALRDSLSKRTQVYTYTSNYQLLGHPVSVRPEAPVPEERPISTPALPTLKAPTSINTEDLRIYGASKYGYRDILPSAWGGYADPTPDRNLGDIIEIIVKDGSSSGEFLVADIEVDQMIYTKVDLATNTEVILDVSRDYSEIQKTIRTVAVKKTNEFVEYFMRQNR